MRIGWRGAFGILLSIALLAWVFRRIEWTEVVVHLRAANVWMLLLSAVVATTCFPLRARRWRTILDPVEPGLPFGVLWRSTAIGMMVNNIVPARAGELARAYALARDSGRVSFSAAFASLAVDRIFDAFVLLSMMFAAMLDPRFPTGTRASAIVADWAGTGTIALVMFLVLLYGIVIFPSRLIAIFEALTRRVAPRFEQRGRDALLAFASGLGVLRSPGRFAAVLAWTVAHWLVNALAFWIGFEAVGIDVPLSGALFLQGLIAIGVALPSSPGFVGVFEAAAVLGLEVYGIDSSHAVTWAIGYHVLSFIPITLIGAWYFMRLGMHLKDLKTAEMPDATSGEMRMSATEASAPNDQRGVRRPEDRPGRTS